MYLINYIQALHIIYIFDLDFKSMFTLFLFVETKFIHLTYPIFVYLIITFLVCFVFHTQIFFLSFLQDVIINWLLDNIVCLLILSKLLLDIGSWLLSLKFLTLAYFVPKSLSTLYSSGEFPGPWIRQVSFNWSLRRYTYLCLHLAERLPISEYTFDEAVSHLVCLMWSARLAYALVVFFVKKVL